MEEVMVRESFIEVEALGMSQILTNGEKLRKQQRYENKNTTHTLGGGKWSIWPKRGEELGLKLEWKASSRARRAVNAQQGVKTMCD